MLYHVHEIMETQYELKITPKALDYIRKKIPNKADYGLVIMNRGQTGGAYDIIVFKMILIQTSRYYPLLFSAEYHDHGFNIYIDPMIINERYLPNSFVIDLVHDLKGLEVLEIKNPEFETINEN